jgi:hypothetical protein
VRIFTFTRCSLTSQRVWGAPCRRPKMGRLKSQPRMQTTRTCTTPAGGLHISAHQTCHITEVALTRLHSLQVQALTTSGAQRSELARGSHACRPCMQHRAQRVDSSLMLRRERHSVAPVQRKRRVRPRRAHVIQPAEGTQRVQFSPAKLGAVKPALARDGAASRAVTNGGTHTQPSRCGAASAGQRPVCTAPARSPTPGVSHVASGTG